MSILSITRSPFNGESHFATLNSLECQASVFESETASAQNKYGKGLAGKKGSTRKRRSLGSAKMVEPRGFEPLTSSVRGMRSPS